MAHTGADDLATLKAEILTFKSELNEENQLVEEVFKNMDAFSSQMQLLKQIKAKNDQALLHLERRMLILEDNRRNEKENEEEEAKAKICELAEEDKSDETLPEKEESSVQTTVNQLLKKVIKTECVIDYMGKKDSKSFNLKMSWVLAGSVLVIAATVSCFYYAKRR